MRIPAVWAQQSIAVDDYGDYGSERLGWAFRELIQLW